jgi:cytochrome P450
MHSNPSPLIETLPDHVNPDLVHPFDVHHDERLTADIHKGYRHIQQTSPDIFYTRSNGGHWVVTRWDLINAIVRDHEHFSNRELEIPRTSSPIKALPINLDPPEHTPYRIMLTKYFSPKTVAALDPLIAGWADRLIDKVYADGGCDFTETLGAGFPVSVFMDMMGLPLEKFEHFRSLVHEFFSDIPVERHVEIQKEIVFEIGKTIDARIEKEEDDLISKLARETVRGRPLERSELNSICMLLFLAGLDTVANVMTFTFRYLAENPDMQDRLRANPDEIPEFVEEALRRFAVVNGIRVVKKDKELGGVLFREGDMVCAPLYLANMDERANPDSDEFLIHREKRQHLTFSTGPHLCLGHYLARAEMRVFVNSFMQRIPRFRIGKDFDPRFRKGAIYQLISLPIEWDVNHG